MGTDPSTYRDLAERAWAWVLTEVRTDQEGPWLRETPDEGQPGESAYGMHSGIGGLAHTMAEIRMARPLTSAELRLADDIGAVHVRRIADETRTDYFDGLTSTIGVLVALGAGGADLAVARLRELATPDGWECPWLGPPRVGADGRCNDATLGTAAVLLGAAWAMEHDVPGADDLAVHAAAVLLEEREVRDGLTYWPFVPLRFLLTGEDVQMPNWSHGQAGVAAAMAVAGVVLDRSDLVHAAASGAEYLLTLADTTGGGLRVPVRIPTRPGQDVFTYSWCHGPTGTSRLFTALQRAGVEVVGGAPPADWERACMLALRESGIPERVTPGFWDNDGRCCGTAGVGDVVLDSWQRLGRGEDLAFAMRLGDALVDRALDDGTHAFWRFVEHRNEDPLLPPGAGWMQGAAGIAAYLFRLARVVEEGRDAPAVPRMDTWWGLPT